MSKKNNKDNLINQGLKILNRCPVCDADYNLDEKNILDKAGGAHLIHVTCKKCGNSLLAMLMSTQIGISSVAMVTDLSDMDVIRIKNKKQISEEELFSFHKVINNNINNFIK